MADLAELTLRINSVDAKTLLCHSPWLAVQIDKFIFNPDSFKVRCNDDN